jgi:hypothetical protein
LSDDERASIEALDLPARQGIRRNALEWLLAEGRMLVRGAPRRVAECVLDPGGALLTPGQRQWIAQMAERPLRLYDVIDVIPGTQLTFRDALDTQGPSIVVSKKTGSQASRLGTRIGLRIMEVDGHHELTEAVYPLSPQVGEQAVEAMRRIADPPVRNGRDLPRALSSVIRRHWLAQLYVTTPARAMMEG